MQEAEYYNLARSEGTHWWYAGMAALAADWLRTLPEPRPTAVPERLLDAGCGTGGGLKWLTQFGPSWGVDRHPLALELAAGNGNQSRLIQADIQALPFADESFSILTAFDVLYHTEVENDWEALREFSRVLRPGGWLLLRLPAHNWLRGGHDAAVHTRHRYTRRELHTKLETVGLRPVRISYVNALLFLPALLWRGSQRAVGARAASDVRQPPHLLNSALMRLLDVERAWLRRFDLPVGLSLLALAQKDVAHEA